MAPRPRSPSATSSSCRRRSTCSQPCPRRLEQRLLTSPLRCREAGNCHWRVVLHHPRHLDCRDCPVRAGAEPPQLRPGHRHRQLPHPPRRPARGHPRRGLVGTAVTLYPIVSRHNKALAMGYVGLRTLEAGIIVTGIASLLAVVTLQHDWPVPLPTLPLSRPSPRRRPQLDDHPRARARLRPEHRANGIRAVPLKARRPFPPCPASAQLRRCPWAKLYGSPASVAERSSTLSVPACLKGSRPP